MIWSCDARLTATSITNFFENGIKSFQRGDIFLYMTKEWEMLNVYCNIVLIYGKCQLSLYRVTSDSYICGREQIC
jgi:hypothetical protein